jgi:hypothetical protein
LCIPICLECLATRALELLPLAAANQVSIKSLCCTCMLYLLLLPFDATVFSGTDPTRVADGHVTQHDNFINVKHSKALRVARLESLKYRSGLCDLGYVIVVVEVCTHGVTPMGHPSGVPPHEAPLPPRAATSSTGPTGSITAPTSR